MVQETLVSVVSPSLILIPITSFVNWLLKPFQLTLGLGLTIGLQNKPVHNEQ